VRPFGAYEGRRGAGHIMAAARLQLDVVVVVMEVVLVVVVVT